MRDFFFKFSFTDDFSFLHRRSAAFKSSLDYKKQKNKQTTKETFILKLLTSEGLEHILSCFELLYFLSVITMN